MHYDEELDALDLVCPLPLLHAKKKLNTMQAGKILKVMTKDRSAIIDFKAYASVSKHELLKIAVQADVFIFYLKKVEESVDR